MAKITLPSVRRLPRSLFAAGLLAVLLAGAALPQDARAQWRQNFEVRTPLSVIERDSLGYAIGEEKTVAGALLDSIIAVSKRENLNLQRMRDDALPPRSVEEIDDEVFRQSQLTLEGSNLVYISYDFRGQGGELNRNITDLLYVSAERAADGAGLSANETKMLYVDVSEHPEIEKLIENGGTRDPDNFMNTVPFRSRLMFQRLFDTLPESRLVSRGGDVYSNTDADRARAEQDRKRLYQIVEQYEYQ